MNEYRITLVLRDNRKMLPDVFGNEQSFVLEAKNARSAQVEIKKNMDRRFGYELYTGELSYQIKDITQI